MEELEEVESSEEDRRWCVYIHTNVHNGKKYIGLTNNIEKRWKNNGSKYLRKHKDGSYVHPVFAKALQKYADWENDWLHEVVADCLTKSEANQKEIELIALYKTNAKQYYNPSYGYNLTDGGDGRVSCGYYHSEETKEKMRKSHPSLQGENHPNYGKHRSEETKEKCRKSNLGKIRSEKTRNKIRESKMGEKNPNYGKSFTEEHRQKISKTESIPVIQLTKTGDFVAEYIGASDAERVTGISSRHIGHCRNHTRITAGGYLWINKSEYNAEHKYSYEESKQLYNQNKINNLKETNNQ